jgi:hypothetical protein
VRWLVDGAWSVGPVGRLVGRSVESVGGPVRSVGSVSRLSGGCGRLGRWSVEWSG